jgi:TusA-related sulfurtransferase
MDTRPDRSLDLRGEKCPFTLLEMGKMLRGLARGQVLEIMVESGREVDEVRAWCMGTGDEFMGSQVSDTVRVYVRKA